jgi:hypothetical protein
MSENRRMVLAVFRHVLEADEISLGQLLQLLAPEFGANDIHRRALSACEGLAKAGAITATHWYEGELTYGNNTFGLPPALRRAIDG